MPLERLGAQERKHLGPQLHSAALHSSGMRLALPPHRGAGAFDNRGYTINKGTFDNEYLQERQADDHCTHSGHGERGARDKSCALSGGRSCIIVNEGSAPIASRRSVARFVSLRTARMRPAASCGARKAVLFGCLISCSSYGCRRHIT